jgi:hypothetical protein
LRDKGKTVFQVAMENNCVRCSWQLMMKTESWPWIDQCGGIIKLGKF